MSEEKKIDFNFENSLGFLFFSFLDYSGAKKTIEIVNLYFELKVSF
jgi:hypothetical protein